MATITVDPNDIVGVNAAALRVLSDNLGDAVTAAFLRQYEKPSGIRDTGHPRPRLTAAQIADAIEYGKAESARLNATVTNHGNFTEDRHKGPQRTHDEVWADIKRIQAERLAKEAAASA